MTDTTKKNQFNLNTSFLSFNTLDSSPITGNTDYQSDANWIAVLANKIAAFKRSNVFKNRHN